MLNRKRPSLYRGCIYGLRLQPSCQTDFEIPPTSYLYYRIVGYQDTLYNDAKNTIGPRKESLGVCCHIILYKGPHRTWSVYLNISRREVALRLRNPAKILLHLLSELPNGLECQFTKLTDKSLQKLSICPAKGGYDFFGMSDTVPVPLSVRYFVT